MVDLHTHILPGVDDGAPSISEALGMLRLAGADGITDVVLTPHFSPGVFDNNKENVLAATRRLREKASRIDVGIHAGSEVLAGPDTLAGIAGGGIPTINGGRYVLVELPGYFQPKPVYDFIFGLTGRGFVPVIAHPERNPKLLGGVSVLLELVRLGALVQVTSGSLAGKFGRGARGYALDIVGRRLAHVIASDAHSAGSRPPRLSDGVAEASRIIGDEAARAMVTGLPGKILDDELVEIPEPAAPGKKFFIF